MRAITLTVIVPEDYDTEPMVHRITQLLEGLQGFESEEPVDQEVVCQTLAFGFSEVRS